MDTPKLALFMFDFERIKRINKKNRSIQINDLNSRKAHEKNTTKIHSFLTGTASDLFYIQLHKFALREIRRQPESSPVC